MKGKSPSNAKFSKLSGGLLLLAVGGGIVFATFVIPGDQVALSLLGGMLFGPAVYLILSAK